MLSNARSLYPKIVSYVDQLEELECQVSIVTETWFKKSKKLEEELEKIENVTGYSVLHRSREAGVGGGVAIICKKGELV